jgi:histidine ammonia-lyase
MVLLDGSHLTFDEVRRVAGGNETVGIAEGAIGAMQRSRSVVEALAAG